MPPTLPRIRHQIDKHQVSSDRHPIDSPASMSDHTTVPPKYVPGRPLPIAGSTSRAGIVMSWLMLGLVFAGAIPCEAQTVTVTGNIPYSGMLLGPRGRLNVWSMSKVRQDKDYTVNPGGATIMEKDSRSRSWNLGYLSMKVEKRPSRHAGHDPDHSPRHRCHSRG